MDRKRKQPLKIDRYPAIVACEVCEVSPRMLDYWVTTGVIQPSRVFESDYPGRDEKRRRAYHLFDFEQLVQIKIVKDLRDAGVSLQRIRYAIDRLRKETGNCWQKTWILTDGQRLYKKMPDPQQAVSLMKNEGGQYVFSIIAVPPACEHVRRALEPINPFRQKDFRGNLKRWKQRTRSA